MEARSLKFVAAACAGEQLSGSPETRVTRISTDSRVTEAGDLFFALPGERFDGHLYLDEVARKGARAVVAERRRAGADLGECAFIAVDDTRRALGMLAAEYRKDFSLPVIAVAGSNGKTSTKELVAAVLRQGRPTLWNEASFNNDIGVPLTLLRLENTHQAAVVEAGTNHPGELTALLKMIAPKYGIITNIGREHLEFFGDVEGVAREEGCLAEALPAHGKLFINGDSEWAGRIAERCRAQVVRVGYGAGNDWRLRDPRLEESGTLFHVDGPRPELAGEYRINLLGRHQAANALFAIAIGAELGLARPEIEHGLAECQPAKMRMQLWELNGARVLDDAYNANADSMLAALQALRELPCTGRRLAVLGDMAELGAQSEAAHEEAGRKAAELGVVQLFAVGKMAGILARGARAGGLHRVLEFADVDGVAVAVKSFLRPGDLLLLKASRSARLERIGQFLRSAEAARKN
jgi:UDP-N-acetylmuramoyl-tripeptide--D-alanyl-D-alanine ligase